MSHADLIIDPTRLLADLNTLRGFGSDRTGVHRPTYSPVDMESRHWFAARLREAGLAAEIDGIGNVIGRDPGDGPRLLVGSHTETQPHAGWLDGALGVIYALEVARASREQGLPGAIDVAAWADEEGHFGSFLGSRSFIGDLSEAEIDAGRNRYDGTPLRDALAGAGLAGLPRAGLEPGRYRGYLEAHIEQGDELEAKGLRIGVVTSIVGIWQYRIAFEGVQNHAGTTRMAIRRDAGVALVRLAGAIDRRFPAVAGPRSVWTTGRITLDPGAPSIIPGAAEMLFQFRDADPEVLARLEVELQALVAEANAGPCRVTLHTLGRSIPKLMDAGLPGRARPRRRAPRPRPASADAERRRPRRADPRPGDAGRDAVRALHRRHQPPLVGGHRRGRHRARRPGHGERRGGTPGRGIGRVRQPPRSEACRNSAWRSSP